MAVIVNGKTVIHHKSKGKLNTTDVCYAPPNNQATPYANLAKSEDVQQGARSVFVNGNPIATIKSNFYKSSGDEGATAGIISGTVNGKANFVSSGSPDVFVEGFPVARQGDLMVSNNGNTPPAPLQQPGAPVPADVQRQINKIMNPNPTDYVYDLDVVGDGKATNYFTHLLIHNQHGLDNQPLTQTGIEEDSNTVTRRLDFVDLGKEAKYLTLRLPNTDGKPIDIPLTNDLVDVRDKVKKSAPAAGKAATRLVPCHIAWNNRQWQEPLAPAPGDLSDLARFNATTRTAVYNDLAKASSTDLQEKPWTALIQPTTLKLVDLFLKIPNAQYGELYQADNLGPGYLYIFKEGYLWRELKVNNGNSFSEVDLTRYAGTDTRPATGVMNPVVILPERIAHHAPLLEMAFSPVQWSWARINYFGGMDPEDLRLQAQTKKIPFTSDTEAAERARAKRCQTISLSPFVHRGAQHNDTYTGDANQPTVINIATDGLPTVLLANPVGAVARLSQDINKLLLQLQQRMQTARKETYFNLALLSQQLFFNPKSAFNLNGKSDAQIEHEIIGASRFATSPFEVAAFTNKEVQPNPYKAVQDNLDQDKINTILSVKERAQVREIITLLQNTLIHMVQSDAIAWYNNPIDFHTQFLDICANSQYEYGQIFSSLMGLLTPTTLAPHCIDSGLDIPTPTQTLKPPAGLAYLVSLSKPSHPLYGALTPTDADINDLQTAIKHNNSYPQFISQSDCVAQDNGDGQFNVLAFVRSFFANKQMAAMLYEALLSYHKAMARIPNNEEQLTAMTSFTKLLHASGDEQLMAIKMGTTGTIDDAYHILGGTQDDVEAYQKATAYKYSEETQKKYFSAEDKAALSRVYQHNDPMPAALRTKVENAPINLVYKAVKSEGYSKAARASSHQGYENRHYDGKVLKQFSKATVINNMGAVAGDATGLYKISSALHDGEVGKLLSTNVFVQAKSIPKSSLHGLTKGASVLMLGLAAYNLMRVRQGLKQYKTKTSKGLYAFELMGFTAYATERAYVQFTEQKRVRELYHLFSKNLSNVSDDWVVKFQDKLGEYLADAKLTPIAAVGALATGINFIFAFDDILKGIHDHDDGEMIAGGLEATGGVFNLLALMADYAEEETVWGTIDAFFAPIGLGLIAAALQMAAIIVIACVKQTPLEKWTKHCPLSNDSPTTVPEHQSIGALFNITMAPQLSVRNLTASTSKHYQTIEVDIALPVFTVGQADLQVETTVQTIEMVAATVYPGSVAMNANAMYSYAAQAKGEQRYLTPTEIKQCVNDQGQVVGMRYIYANVPLHNSAHSDTPWENSQKNHFRTRVRLKVKGDKYQLPSVAHDNTQAKTTKGTKDTNGSEKLAIDAQQPGWYYIDAEF